MQLLIVILHHEEVLDDILAQLVELELPDAVVIDSRSGLELLERDLPLFAGLRALVPGGIDFCRTVLCLVDDDLAHSALAAVAGLGLPPAEGEPLNTAMLLPVVGYRHF